MQKLAENALFHIPVIPMKPSTGVDIKQLIKTQAVT